MAQIAQEDNNAPEAAVAPVDQAQLQKSDSEGKQEDAIKFIRANLDTSFNEQQAKQLFSLYALDQKTQRLQPPDVRKLLLDILCAAEWPLVVPDESLDAVLHDLCLNDEGSISWIEFKSFFVFLQDRPLSKLLEIITANFTKNQLSSARLITIKPKPIPKAKSPNKKANAAVAKNANEKLSDPLIANAKSSDVESSENVAVDEPAEAVDAVEAAEVDEDDKKREDESSYYDRSKWKSLVSSLMPSARHTFIYFMDGYQVLALSLGGADGFADGPLLEAKQAELRMENVTYLATIRGFDVTTDVFPPIARSGGLKSKVARRIADSYLIAREWDAKNFGLAAKASSAATGISVKWASFDEKYGVVESVEATATSLVQRVKGIDARFQLTRRLSASAKQIDEKLGLSSKAMSVVEKVGANEKVQSVGQKMNATLKSAVKTIDDIGQETQQLVQEKRQHGIGLAANGEEGNMESQVKSQ